MNRQFLKNYQNIIDLTFSLENNMPCFPSKCHIKFKIKPLGTIKIDGRNTSEINFSSHTGTHVDAPSHFFIDGYTIDKIPLNDLIGPAVLLNLGNIEPGEKILADDIHKTLKNSRIKKLVIRTGWSRFWKTNQYYKDWPYLDQSACELLIEKKIKLLGMDFPSPDKNHVSSGPDSPNHKKLMSEGVILVEYLNNLNKLKPGKIFLIVMPLNIKDSDGSPARVAAFNI